MVTSVRLLSNFFRMFVIYSEDHTCKKPLEIWCVRNFRFWLFFYEVVIDINKLILKVF